MIGFQNILGKLWIPSFRTWGNLTSQTTRKCLVLSVLSPGLSMEWKSNDMPVVTHFKKVVVHINNLSGSIYTMEGVKSAVDFATAVPAFMCRCLLQLSALTT